MKFIQLLCHLSAKAIPGHLYSYSLRGRRPLAPPPREDLQTWPQRSRQQTQSRSASDPRKDSATSPTPEPAWWPTQRHPSTLTILRQVPALGALANRSVLQLPYPSEKPSAR